MKRFILYYFIAFTLLSCGNPQSRFRLTGEFEHLQQGEFYLYSPENGLTSFDTIKIINGNFDYQTEIDNSDDYATLHLLYPNFTEQVIFAKNGTHVQIKGDARKLSETEVTGTEENKLLTNFRKQHLNSSPNELMKAAAAFIKEKPESPVSRFLFQKYILDAVHIDTILLQDTYKILSTHQPESTQILKWQSVITAKTQKLTTNTFGQLSFIDTKRDTTTFDDCKGKPVLLTVWASWLGSSYHNYQTKKLWTQYQDSIQILSISLDLSANDLNEEIKRNDIRWPIYCSFEGWNDVLLEKIVLKEIPYALLFDKEHNLVVSGNNISEDITPVLKKLIHIEEP